MKNFKTIKTNILTGSAHSYITAIMKNPKGSFSIVGRCPEHLAGKVFKTEAQAVEELRKCDGIEKYQSADFTIKHL